LTLVSAVVFSGNSPLAYTVFPLLFWTALRFRQAGAVVAGLLVSGFAVWYTAHGQGPFVTGSPDVDLLRAQTFVGIATITALLVAAVRTEGQVAFDSEHRLAEAQQLAHLGSWEWLIASNEVSWSTELCRIYGVEAAGFGASYEAFLELVHPDDREGVGAAIATALADVAPFDFEHRVVRPDGEIRTLHARGEVLTDASGTPVAMSGTGQDITARKHDEQARLVQHAMLADAEELADAGSFEYDVLTGSVRWSAGMYRIRGIEAREGLTPAQADGLDPRDREWVQNALRETLAGDATTCELTYRIVRPDGDVRWLETRHRIERDVSGIAVRMHGASMDVTIRTREQEQLATAARYFELSRDLVCTLGFDGHFKQLNAAWTETLGWSEAELCSRQFVEFIHPDDRDATTQEADGLEQDGVTLKHFVNRYATKDGGWRWIDWNAMSIVADELIYATGRDVTEHRAAEEAARLVQSRLQAILDHLPVGIYLRGLDERYQLVNSYFAREFGRPAEEIIGRTALELHPGALVDWARELERPIHDRGETVSSESSAPHADGTDHHHWVIKYPVTDGDGDLIGIGGAVLDITARRQAELALANAEAEHAALLRVATAVAEDLGPAAVFELVAEEVARLMSCAAGVVLRFESDDEASVLGVWSADPSASIDSVVKLDGTNASSLVARTGKAARIDRYGADGAAGVDAREGVAAPITIAGKLWGSVGAATTGDGVLPADAEERVAHFAELVATAIGNAEARETLARHAATDALTGLPNYRTFHDRLRSERDRATRYGRQLSLVLIDIDHFKAINDEHGHSVGDKVLTGLAQRLAALVRGSDLVARVGGEEFGWLLPETDAMSAFAVTERARMAIERAPFDIVGTVTISAGVCSLEDSDDVDSLLSHADSALYWAKESGRNATFRYTEQARAALAEAPAPKQRFQSMSSIRALARVIDAKNRATSHHSERVADLSERIALGLGWTTKRARQLHEAATLHDIGKIATPDAILLKPGRLTPDEYAETQRHAAVGAQIAAEVLEPEAVGWIRHHHEHWDGSGYPQQLSGHAIPDGAQIIGVCEAMDAMTHRLYRTALSFHDALEECANQRGRQFAPDVVDALLRTAATDLDETHARA
jgi:diguanylate cyclase (GGDEF)-like protein/PAS domain S-box-containing protein/putative nucleotidyltransferase with HDIG domain